MLWIEGWKWGSNMDSKRETIRSVVGLTSDNGFHFGEDGHAGHLQGAWMKIHVTMHDPNTTIEGSSTTVEIPVKQVEKGWNADG